MMYTFNLKCLITFQSSLIYTITNTENLKKATMAVIESTTYSGGKNPTE